MTTAEPSHLPYWARKLAGFQHRPRPFPAFLEAPGETVAGVPVAWPAELRAGSEADGLDLLCLGALAALVARYAGESEVLIAAQGACAPVFHRVAAEPGTSPREFLRALDAERRESQARADYAYADLLALLEPEAPGAAAACFQVAYRGVGDHGAWPEGITPALSLTLEAPGRLCLSAHGYEAAFVTQLAGQLGRALAFLARGDAPELDALDLLDADQERRVALEFNAHAAEYPETGRTLHALGALQAARRPEAEAVVFEGRRLTRAQVQDLAARLALHLRARRGVRPGDAVGLVLKRSELMPPVMLGVLMAGAAYVPIDPRHPRPVVDGMLADAGVRVLLVDSDSAAHAATFQGEVLVTDVELDELPPAAAPLPATSDEELAYVIFTSGSTGRPKGVAIEHRAIVNTVAWRNRFYGFGDDDAILQMPSYAFDSSVLDFFCALTSGARLVIPDADRRLDPDYLLRLVAAERVTHFIVTPSYYGVLVAGLAAAGTLRSVTVAGEAIPPELVEEHFRRLPGVRLCNEYGPTENAVCSTAAWLAPGRPSAPIGPPIANVRALVLDARGRLTPVGLPGEIHLGGPGLARGYVGQPEQTAAAFIPSPRPEWCPGRLYRTGDRGAWRSDGQLEFFGRADNQVKVRGHRIELDHVEGVLRSHPALAQAAVVVKGRELAERRLAAYYVARGELAPAALRRFLAERLPHFMVPDVIVALDALPLNVNGKLDRERLSRRDDDLGGTRATAGSALEAELLALCAEVLGRRDLGPDDNFFEVGGNSLGAVELVTRVRARLRLELGVLEVYSYPSVRELALRLAGGRAGPSS